MKTLGLVYAALGKGGIERGASFQIPMFRKAGWRVVVFTALPASDDDYLAPDCCAHVCIGVDETAGRSQKLAAALQAHGVDLLVHHDAYRADVLAADLAIAHAEGVKAVVFWHSVFSHFYLRRGRQLEAKSLFEAVRGADAMITLTSTDAVFFRLYGIPAQPIPYADPDLMSGFVRESWPRRLIWMGRFVELKRPLDALRIFERVLGRFSDAEFLMLGDGDETPVIRDYLAAHPRLAKSVICPGFVNDVRPFLEKAGVGLLTSRFEGYCHSIVEMQMASLPVVAYEMPWLDTLGTEAGALQVSQGDVAAAADVLCRLLDDREECRRRGGMARAAYEAIAGRDQERVYAEFFDRVMRGELDVLRRIDPDAAGAAVRTFVLHADAALRLAAEDVRAETLEAYARYMATNRSYRIGRALTWPLRECRKLLSH